MLVLAIFLMNQQVQKETVRSQFLPSMYTWQVMRKEMVLLDGANSGCSLCESGSSSFYPESDMLTNLVPGIDAEVGWTESRTGRVARISAGELLR